MRKKKISRSKNIDHNKIQTIVMFVVSSVALIAFLFLIWCDTPSYAVNAINNKVIKKIEAPLPIVKKVGVPLRIKIPSISVDAVIEKVGLKDDGSMDVPKEPLNTGWYELGVRPGEVGSAVIDGHLDWWYGAKGVFENLSKLKAGDKIKIEDDEGIIISFAVREIRSYDAADNATDVFISNDYKSHLNLVTCGGVWDNNTNQYAKRLVVFADRE